MNNYYMYKKTIIRVDGKLFKVWWPTRDIPNKNKLRQEIKTDPGLFQLTLV